MRPALPYVHSAPHPLTPPPPSTRLSMRSGYTLTSWDELVPQFKYLPEQPYFQILVHTTDTTRMAALLETCLAVGRPVLLNGASGVGKSAVVLDTLGKLGAKKNYMPVVSGRGWDAG